MVGGGGVAGGIVLGFGLPLGPVSESCSAGRGMSQGHQHWQQIFNLVYSVK